MIFFIFACAIVQSSCSSKKEVVNKNSVLIKDAELKHFYRTDNLGNILDLAEKNDKLVYVDIYAEWCLPCKVMNKSVYKDKETMDYLNENFILYKVDGEKVNGPDLVALFEVRNYPGILFLNQRGGVLEKKLGSATTDELRTMGDRALSTLLSQSIPDLLDDTCADVSQ